jgi:hypothetical protein
MAQEGSFGEYRLNESEHILVCRGMPILFLYDSMHQAEDKTHWQEL